MSGEVTCLAARGGRKEGTGNNEALVKSQVFVVVWFCFLSLFSNHVTPRLKSFQELVAASRIKVKSPGRAGQAF